VLDEIGGILPIHFADLGLFGVGDVDRGITSRVNGSVEGLAVGIIIARQMTVCTTSSPC
jgi:hypothetical protein